MSSVRPHYIGFQTFPGYHHGQINVCNLMSVHVILIKNMYNVLLYKCRMKLQFMF